MNSKELKEKISEISNSEFPLIDFFNDIGWLEGIKWFNTEKAYEDIEKIYNVFVYYRDKLEQLKKALDILKEYICITKRRNEVNGNYDISCIYSFGSYKDITQEAYELLKEVLGND